MCSSDLPEGVDGRDLLPLLANPGARVREVLPLFNFWGILSAQSMAVVTPEWKYIYWYYAGDGMKPVEELFHVGRDRYELATLASNPEYASELETMRRHYDAEVVAIREKVMKGHGHEQYPVLFDRNVGWEEKAPLLKALQTRGGDGEEKGDGGGRRKKAKGET